MSLSKLSVVSEQIEEAYRKGASLKTIATANECSVNTVRKFLANKGVVIRTRGRKKKEVIV